MRSKENNTISLAISIFLRHCGGVIIANIFNIALARFVVDNLVGSLICSVVYLFVYAIPIYTAMWSIGHRDLNLEKFGHVKKKPYRGLLIGLLASVPTFVLTILFILSKFNLFYNFVLPFKMMNAEIIPLINIIQRSMYLPDFTVGEVFGVAALTLIPALLCGCFYLFGNFDFIPTRWLVYKKDKDEKQ